jgi:hypothetical protein
MTAAGTTENSVPLFFPFSSFIFPVEFYNVRDEEEHMQKWFLRLYITNFPIAIPPA